MDHLRCPTCLSLLGDGDEKRCPYCRTRFGNRGRPIVLGESNKISARPVLPIEWDLQTQVMSEHRAQQRRRRAAAMADAPPGRPLPQSFLAEAREGTAAPDRPRHRPRRRRRIAPKSRIDTAPASPRARFDADADAEVVEARVEEPEMVVEPEAAFDPEVVDPEVIDLTETPDPAVREVVIPEVLFEDEAAASDPGSDAREHLLSASTGSPRVKKIAKRRKGWVVDYVVPESEPASGDFAP